MFTFCVHQIVNSVRKVSGLHPTQFLAHFFAMNVIADDEWRGYQKKMMSKVLEEMKSLCEVL